MDASGMAMRRKGQPGAAIISAFIGARVMTAPAGQASGAGAEATCEDSGVGATAVAAAGDVELLYREHSGGLVKRLTRQTGCRDTALELAQEAFVRLLRLTPGRFRSIEQPEAYLHRISANLVRDWARACRVARCPVDERAAVPQDPIDQVAVLESRDTLRRLELAMARLKPRTRAIFIAHRLEGLTYAEIAERTGLTVKGVEKQMAKAIAKIDRMLDRRP